MTPQMHRTARHFITNSDHFEKDCEYFYCQLIQNFDWFTAMDIFRQLAVLALVFALGWKNFIALADIIFFLSRQDYLSAAEKIEEKGLHYIADILKNGEIKFAEVD